MNPGRLDRRVTFRRRASVGGVHSGALQDVCSCWAAWRPLSAQQLVEAGASVDAVAGTLTVRDTQATRAIAAECRAVFSGQDLVVVSASIPDRSGYLMLEISRRTGAT